MWATVLRPCHSATLRIAAEAAITVTADAAMPEILNVNRPTRRFGSSIMSVYRPFREFPET